jgi:hypothetical protein
MDADDPELIIIPGQPGTPGATGSPGNPGAQGPQGPPGSEPDDPENLLVPGQRGEPGPQGVAGPRGMWGDDGEDAPIERIPGVPGVQGTQGNTGATGAQGAQGIPGNDGEDAEHGLLLPGPPGTAGTTGPQGPPGPPAFPLAQPDDPDLPFIVKGDTGTQGIQGSGGGGTGVSMPYVPEPDDITDWVPLGFPGAGAAADVAGGNLGLTSVEVNLGSTLKASGKFTVTDASVSTASRIAIWQAPGPYTNKGSRVDEALMDRVTAIAVPGAGQFDVYWETIGGYVGQPGPGEVTSLNPTIGGAIDAFGANVQATHVARRIGRVRGNMKFLYTVDEASLGVSSAWTQVIDESGASFANFTGDSGTWASASSVIKQTDTAAVMHRAHYNTQVVQSHLIFEAEIQIKTVSNDKIGGLLIGYDGANGTGSYEVRLNESVAGNAGAIQTENSGIGAFTTINTTIDIDTWYKLRLVFAGDTVSIYLDGVLKGFSRGNSSGAGPTEIDGHYVGLMSYGAETWFRNIKAWTLTLPA